MAKKTCDGCYKQRNDVRFDKVYQSDGTWEFHVVGYCFLCRKQWEKGKIFSFQDGKYKAMDSDNYLFD